MSKSPRNPKSPGIGKAELEILEFIHDHHPATVREVADHLAQSRGLVRTTALNVMNRLVQKGFLTRKKTDGIFQYSPRLPRGTLFRNLIRDFVSETLGGSVSPFVAYLADDARLTEDELAQLRKVVRELEPRKEKP
ncbi:MAG TPA: BlaI/MecI/CopY family transcriptional regulator [Phycisphaerae bacterium]|nr:BlaI/MecI/CopY family transcriptional regulator [Phycisphaerae bacterium]